MELNKTIAASTTDPTDAGLSASIQRQSPSAVLNSPRKSGSTNSRSESCPPADDNSPAFAPNWWSAAEETFAGLRGDRTPAAHRAAIEGSAALGASLPHRTRDFRHLPPSSLITMVGFVSGCGIFPDIEPDIRHHKPDKCKLQDSIAVLFLDWRIEEAAIVLPADAPTGTDITVVVENGMTILVSVVQ